MQDKPFTLELPFALNIGVLKKISPQSFDVFTIYHIGIKVGERVAIIVVGLAEMR